MARAPSLDVSSRKEKAIFQRDGLRKSMIVSKKIHFLYTTFLHFVKIERMKDSLIYSLYFVSLLGVNLRFVADFSSNLIG